MAREAFDLVLDGGRIVDGSGASAQRADVGVRGDRIAAVGDLADAATGMRLDVSGHVVAPGFIDVHSHDDGAVLVHPTMDFKVLQGVTTDVVGNCGLGPAPYAVSVWALRSFHPRATFPTWDGHAGYLALLDREPPSLNVGVLVGHNMVRATVMGGREEAPSDADLAAMEALVDEGMAAGAIGLSTGLIYEPGRHAHPPEITALARRAAAAGGIYTSHMRDEGTGLLDSIAETIAIGADTGIAVQVSHHKAAGRDSWGLVRRSLALLDAARARGIDVAADQYPYTAGSTVLAAVVQNGALTPAGGPLGRLEPGDVRIASAPRHPEWEGRTIEELAVLLERSPLAAAEHIVAEEGPAASAILEVMCEDDVRTVMQHPTTMIGSDGLPSLDGKPHPRLYGTFPRVLGRYARDAGILTLEDAVHRMTGMPAARFGFAGRGLVRPGYLADLVVFDPATICDRGTYEEPHRAPEGIRHVLVNGTLVVRDAAHTGARPGRCLRRGEGPS
ncbi:MAG TPA: D-aminoacylase [Candidatus Binatia bacterium]|jgi:N-acyl-D-amino-acid deacylase|nr:D-aminoacylase [Candidatus Binatia bacterium]